MAFKCMSYVFVSINILFLSAFCFSGHDPCISEEDRLVRFVGDNLVKKDRASLLFLSKDYISGGKAERLKEEGGGVEILKELGAAGVKVSGLESFLQQLPRWDLLHCLDSYKSQPPENPSQLCGDLSVDYSNQSVGNPTAPDISNVYPVEGAPPSYSVGDPDKEVERLRRQLAEAQQTFSDFQGEAEKVNKQWITEFKSMCSSRERIDKLLEGTRMALQESRYLVCEKDKIRKEIEKENHVSIKRLQNEWEVYHKKEVGDCNKNISMKDTALAELEKQHKATSDLLSEALRTGKKLESDNVSMKQKNSELTTSEVNVLAALDALRSQVPTTGRRKGQDFKWRKSKQPKNLK